MGCLHLFQAIPRGVMQLRMSPLRGAYSDGVDMEMVRKPESGLVQNHTMGNAVECFIHHCDTLLHACGGSPACRGAWTDMLEGLGSVVELALLLPEHIPREDTRELASCFFSRCLCVADLATGYRTGTGSGPGTGAGIATPAPAEELLDGPALDGPYEVRLSMSADGELQLSIQNVTNALA